MNGETTTTPVRRVLFVDHTAELGGGELAMLNLVSHMDRRRYEPIVLLFSDGPLVGRLKAARVPVHILPLSGSVVRAKKDGLGWRSLLRVGDVVRTAAQVLRLAKVIRRERATLVHCNSLKADIIGGLAGRLARRPVIWHVHDRIESGYLPSQVARFFRVVARWLPAAVVANSRSTLATLHLPPRFAATVAPPGLRPEAFSVTRSSALADRSVVRIGIVGRIARWKGQDVFLRAAARVRQVFPEAHFLIVGGSLFAEGAYEAQLHELVRALGLDDCVEFAGHRDDAREIMAQLDVFVHASTRPEPFGQVITEAMAAGAPVVATDGGGAPEIVTHGETGFLVPMGDVAAMAEAIIRLLQDPVHACAMAARAREDVVARFGIGVTAERVSAMYDLVLHGLGGAVDGV